MANEMHEQFSKYKAQKANKHNKDSSIFLAIRKMHFKTILRFHLTPGRMSFLKKRDNSLYWAGCGKKGSLMNCYWNANFFSYCLAVPTKNQNRTPYDSAVVPLL